MSKKNSLKRRKRQHEFVVREAQRQEEQAAQKRERRAKNKADMDEIFRLDEKATVGDSAPKKFNLGKASEKKAAEIKEKKQKDALERRGMGIVKTRRADERRRAKILKRAVEMGKMVD